MIRRIGRNALRALAALVAAAGAENKKVATVVPPSVVHFDYRSLNPHGCPWPGRVEARRRMGYTRRPKTK